MKAAWAVAAATLVAVPILALPTHAPAQADVATPRADEPAGKDGIAIVVHRGGAERPGKIHIGF